MDGKQNDKISVVSRSSRSSASSSGSLIRARAKAEAAKARLAFAEQEAKAKIERAAKEAEQKKEIADREAEYQKIKADKDAAYHFEKVKRDAELEELVIRREAAAAEAEAAVWELADAQAYPLVLDEVGPSEEDKMERTSDYITSHFDPQSHKSCPSTDFPDQVAIIAHSPKSQPPANETLFSPRNPFNPEHRTPAFPNETSYANVTSHSDIFDYVYVPPAVKMENQASHRAPDQQSDSKECQSNLNKSAQPFYPKSMPTASYSAPTTEHLAQYLARRDLVNSSLYQFDDKPEHYRAWQSSYTNVTQGLGLTPTEELDLMIKWLGRESSNHVKRIRSVHITNPVTALKKAWDRLQECYAAPEMIERSLFDRLGNFPRVSAKEHVKLRELSDLLMEVQCAKEDGYLPALSYLDTARGIEPIVAKLPYGLQERWISAGSKHKEENKGQFPPFEFFSQFISYEARKRNDPSFSIPSACSSPTKFERAPFKGTRNPISVHKTDVDSTHTRASNVKGVSDPNKSCPIHSKPHPLKRCKAFRAKNLEERKTFLKERGICFRCCSSTTHFAKDCQNAVKCMECESTYHDSAMHPGPASQVKASSTSPHNGGEGEENNTATTVVNSSCTEVCGPGQIGRSCSKICLAKVYRKGQPDKHVKAYVILDDQSNRSLARSSLFELFNVECEPYSYYLKTCSGTVEASGRRAEAFIVESLDGRAIIPLPPLIECNDILDNRSEIPTPSAARHHPHLAKVAEHIPDIDPTAEILLLLGRDVIRVHKVREQVNGPHNAPFAQRLDLGWVLVGEVCLGSAHRQTVNTFKTTVLENGRPSLLQPCTSFLHIKEKIDHGTAASDGKSEVSKPAEEVLGQTVFNHTERDNKLASSIEDDIFLKLMGKEVYRDESNSWVAPLPFRQPRQRLPNNREQAAKRFASLQCSLNKRPEMQQQYMAFMGKILENGHAEVAPSLGESEECWYLPTFGVFHPQKPGQIRVVFDSSAKHLGISLNDVLLTGPDLNNTLLGVLMRFRKEKVAILADIQQMFHCFLVRQDHRNYLRFLWYKDNDMTKEIIDYRMTVHVFGNSPSPAVAIYGLRRAIKEGAQEHGTDTVNFVERHFYVDDGLLSVPTDAEAIDLLRRTQTSLAESNLRLHKFVSNSQTVLEAFPPEDCAAIMEDVDFCGEAVLTQRSLGLLWEIKSDTFTFSVAHDSKPFTRRGVLSTVNSVFDPLGFLAPVTIQGRALLRELTAELSDWDTTLPEDKLSKWQVWQNSLMDLRHLHVPRTYTTASLAKAVHVELCVFSDASTKAIGAVAYLKTVQEDGETHVGFVMGKAKLAPQSEPTIPRLELCAAVLAVEMADLIRDELDLKLDSMNFFTDSKVVLGYIFNESRRFYVYVHNRVQRIRQTTKPDQWHYVRTEDNPADYASRSVPASLLAQTMWFTGPDFLLNPPNEPEAVQSFDLVKPELDPDIRPPVRSYATHLQEKGLSTERFQRFSSFNSLVRAIALLIHIARSYNLSNHGDKCKGWHKCDLPRTPEELSQAEEVIISAVQKRPFPKEFEALTSNKPVPLSSSLRCLSPTLQNNLICLGGRLKNANLEIGEKNPIILPKDDHVSLLLVRHHHAQVKHQGRHLTEGAVRAAGLWLLGGKRLINSVLHKCVTCRKLRGRIQEQRMADLPPQRLQTCPPFTYVGLDVFGPWLITTRRTRGGQAESKRWAILFCCMSSRAVHIEVIDSMDTSSCINALRRFFAIRGPAKQLMSDCGTNFMGACKELGISKNQPDSTVQRYLNQQGCSWEFNPPHASHMGGSWERLIGVARILDSMFLEQHTRLTHDVLCTLMAEVTAIINARPLIPVSNDPEDPFILSPSMLLTQKVGVPPPPGDFIDKDLLTKQWRQVQVLANKFWSRWSREYLPTLQHRRKWNKSHPNLQEGDLVLLKDSQAARNNWPMAIITKAFSGSDGRVRKVELKTTDQGHSKTFFRPVSEVVLLLAKNDVQRPA
ncbi:uncharacterized protein LOC121906755 [Thunnus maccoyii]|uniref:uncharacterized protein LOC121906755 n=1 Tax=Thunnus maccoyii TaxID=8240 RepID=UPI001C4B3EF7|nr:uncharacterized protein LOC121906755 [Thunnus maccoyii]